MSQPHLECSYKQGLLVNQSRLPFKVVLSHFAIAFS